jgi:transposase
MRQKPQTRQTGAALRREARDLKEVVAEQTLELRLLKKSMIADGGDVE